MSDPHGAYVTLFLPLSGDFSDASAFKRTMTVAGNVAASTDTAAFGSISTLFDGSDDWLTTDYRPVLAGDFTLECFVYPLSVATYGPIFDGRTAASYSNFVVGMWPISGTIRPDFVTDTGRLTGTTTSFPLNQWTHYAVCRSGSTVSAFVGGVKDATTYSYSGSMQAAGATLRVGGIVDPGSWHGYLQYARITDGIARYTEDFTPPAAPFDPPDAPAGKILLLPASCDPVFGGHHRIASTVDRLGSPGPYPVRLYHRPTGRLVRASRSDANGNYAFEAIKYEADGYFAVAHDTNGEPLNAAIADLLTPEPM